MLLATIVIYLICWIIAGAMFIGLFKFIEKLDDWDIL
jgi:hypothetical protein